MRLAVAAISCGLASFLAACSGGPSAPAGAAGATNSSPGPFAPVVASGPFAPVAAPGPLAPVASPGPFAPVTDPGPFGVNPSGTTGGGTVADACATACGRAVEFGCPSETCEADCIGSAAQIPEACHAAYAAVISCAAQDICNATGDAGIQGCDGPVSAVMACVRDARAGGRPGGPPVPRPDGG